MPADGEEEAEEVGAGVLEGVLALEAAAEAVDAVAAEVAGEEEVVANAAPEGAAGWAPAAGETTLSPNKATTKIAKIVTYRLTPLAIILKPSMPGSADPRGHRAIRTIYTLHTLNPPGRALRGNRSRKESATLSTRYIRRAFHSMAGLPARWAPS